MRPLLRAANRRLPRRRPRLSSEPYPVCDDLGIWAEAWPGAERQVIDAPFTTTRPMPRSIEDDAPESFASLGSFPVPERALVKIPGARVRGSSGLVVLPDDAFVGELVALTPAGRRTMLEQQSAYAERLPARPTRKEGSYYSFLGFGYYHYYHWIHDLVMGARGIAELLPPDTRLIVPAVMQPWQRETLALLELDDHVRVPFPEGACWELENLYVVTPRLKTQIDSPGPYRWFRGAVMDRYSVDEGTPTRRLYLTRRHDNHWRTTNEPEVEALLATYGFETVAPGKLGFREQVELFAHAEVIVGTGAGLFNMVFSPPGTKVLQFQERTHMVQALWTQAAAMGFDYYYVVGESVPNPDAHDADIRMPIDKLDASLELMHLPSLAENGAADPTRPGHRRR